MAEQRVTLKIFTLCDKCNKEFEITSWDNDTCVWARCPHCGASNLRWLRLKKVRVAHG